MSMTETIPTRIGLQSQNCVEVQDVDRVDPAEAENPWVLFFEIMRDAPRDEHWEEFIGVMRARPMNQLPVERNLFRDAQ